MNAGPLTLSLHVSAFLKIQESAPNWYDGTLMFGVVPILDLLDLRFWSTASRVFPIWVIFFSIQSRFLGNALFLSVLNFFLFGS